MTVTDIDDVAMGDIAEAVKEGKCILFLGAGAHVPPPPESRFVYAEDERPPLGRTLSERLAERVNLAAAHPNESLANLQRTSLFFETMRGRRQLVSELRDAIHVGKKPSPALCALAELGFPLMVTTNFDQLLERALTEAGREPIVSVYSPDSNQTTDDLLDDPTADRPFVFKIHGDIGHPESIVITDEDYIQFVLRMADQSPYYPVPGIFRYHFVRWTTLFLGYSLIDYNLRLLFKTLRWKIDPANIPDTYSVDRYPDPLIFDVWHNQRRYVKFIVQDVWTFVPDLYRRVTGREMPDYRG
jgi:SIR2-like protein